MDLIEQHVLERLSITNAYSAFIEVFVSDKADSDYKVLLFQRFSKILFCLKSYLIQIP